MVAVFREVRRVLRNDGTLWLNIGDSYNAHPGQRTEHDKAGWKQASNRGSCETASRSTTGLKPKDLVGIPWRVAFALQADGWYLRSDIIWSKPNAMPESVTDRPTKSHEYLFLLAKSERYFYEADAIRESANGWNGSRFEDGKNLMVHPNVGKNRPSAERGSFNGKTEAMADEGRNAFRAVTGTRNKRSVWTIATQPYSGSHFACVDEETECLTSTGWKSHSDLQPGMLGAQFNLTTGKMSWAPIEDIARYEVSSQNMVVGSCRDMDMWLTPNHRTVIQRRHSSTRKWQQPTIILAEGLKASHSVPTAADWSFEGDATTPLEWAELLGWYVAEGHESKNCLTVEIYQSAAANGPKCRRIEELLRQTGAEWTKATCKRTWLDRDADMTAYRVMGYAAVRLREMAPGKRLPWGTVLWSHDRIAALLAGLIDGDGHERADDGRRCFVQKDNDQCGLVQALSLRLGMSATVGLHKDSGCGIVYLTSHKTRSFRGTNGAGSPPSIQKYTGVVWCPKLPDGTWMARRNGKPFITGNTFPEKLVEICLLAGSRPGDLVFDPFVGSGTVIRVATRLQRKGVGCDLSWDYLDKQADKRMRDVQVELQY
jgi:DNA modification methylase